MSSLESESGRFTEEEENKNIGNKENLTHQI